MTDKIIVAALYCFVSIKEVEGLKQQLLDCCADTDLRGTLLLAAEGVNGTIAGSRDAVDNIMIHLAAGCDLAKMEYKESYCSDNPFLRMKVKLKKEIVTIGDTSIAPSKLVGEYVTPRQWNELILDPEVIVIDTRNEYEVAIGTFKGARDPKTTNFRQFPKYVLDNLSAQKHRKVAMFCTGGIRCEKASSYMLSQGFTKVYHLKGGVLAYLAEIPPADSLWEGECFVFDERVAVNHKLEVGSYEQCFGCRHPITAIEKAATTFVAGVSCPYCNVNTSPKQKQRFSERKLQIDIAKKQGQQHLGMPQNKVKKRININD